MRFKHEMNNLKAEEIFGNDPIFPGIIPNEDFGEEGYDPTLPLEINKARNMNLP